MLSVSDIDSEISWLTLCPLLATSVSVIVSDNSTSSVFLSPVAASVSDIDSEIAWLYSIGYDAPL